MGYSLTALVCKAGFSCPLPWWLTEATSVVTVWFDPPAATPLPVPAVCCVVVAWPRRCRCACSKMAMSSEVAHWLSFVARGGIGPHRTARQFRGFPLSNGLNASGCRRLSHEPYFTQLLEKHTGFCQVGLVENFIFVLLEHFGHGGTFYQTILSY